MAAHPAVEPYWAACIRLIDPFIEDEDGVQFAGGTVLNTGSIVGSDDGVDMDEGTVTNTSTGEIISTGPDGSGIDIDEIYDDGIVERQNATVKVVNAGLIEGNAAIGSDDAATNDVMIENSGTLRGRSGTSLRMAPNQGKVTLDILAGSIIEGDAAFGSADDSVIVNQLFSGELISGGGMLFGSDGVDTFTYQSAAFDFADITTFDQQGDAVELVFNGVAGVVSGMFNSFEFWTFGGQQYSTDEVSRLVSDNDVAPVPLPAGFALLLTAFGGLVATRRRRA